MRYSASEKLEIIELVEQSTLSVARTLASIGILRLRISVIVSGDFTRW
jgi:transposase-like protein